jgi:hypothetical protein
MLAPSIHASLLLKSLRSQLLGLDFTKTRQTTAHQRVAVGVLTGYRDAWVVCLFYTIKHKLFVLVLSHLFIYPLSRFLILIQTLDLELDL